MKKDWINDCQRSWSHDDDTFDRNHQRRIDYLNSFGGKKVFNTLASHTYTPLYHPHAVPIDRSTISWSHQDPTFDRNYQRRIDTVNSHDSIHPNFTTFILTLLILPLLPIIIIPVGLYCLTIGFIRLIPHSYCSITMKNSA